MLPGAHESGESNTPLVVKMMRYIFMSNLVFLCQIWCFYVKFGVFMSNLVFLCQIWYFYVKFGVFMSKLVLLSVVL